MAKQSFIMNLNEQRYEKFARFADAIANAAGVYFMGTAVQQHGNIYVVGARVGINRAADFAEVVADALENNPKYIAGNYDAITWMEVYAAVETGMAKKGR